LLIDQLLYIEIWSIGEVCRLSNQRIVHRFLSADYDNISETQCGVLMVAISRLRSYFDMQINDDDDDADFDFKSLLLFPELNKL